MGKASSKKKEVKNRLPEESIKAIKALIMQEQQRAQGAQNEISNLIKFSAIGAGLIKAGEAFVFSPGDFTINKKEEKSCENKTSQT